MHSPIVLDTVSLHFPHKACFENFSTTIYHGDRIGIIGRNGSGKSTLLKMLQGFLEPSQGTIHLPDNVTFG